jgi:hypothetical protein
LALQHTECWLAALLLRKHGEKAVEGLISPIGIISQSINLPVPAKLMHPVPIPPIGIAS